ncbi:hypothetical protein BH09MYX1_BH09MYX1_67290 [soil metagenome]
MYEFDEGALRTRLVALPAAYRAAFSCSCGERVSRLHFGFMHELPEQVAKARALLDETWELVRYTKATNELEKRCRLEMAALDPGAAGEYGDQIEDVLATILYSIQSLAEDGAHAGAFAARRAYEAADRIVLDETSGNFITPQAAQASLRGEAVQGELRAQLEILSSLEAAHRGGQDPEEVIAMTKEVSRTRAASYRAPARGGSSG